MTTVFTVPTANVASTPPVPVSTFIVKTINVHNYDGSAAVTVEILIIMTAPLTLQIFQVDVSAYKHKHNKHKYGLSRRRCSMKVQANAASRAMVEISLLEVKQQL